MEENWESSIDSILLEGERIGSFSVAKKTGTIYILFQRGEFAYLPIRIADHRTISFFANRTFNKGQDIEKLLSVIRRYLDESDWYIFKYEDYFTLRALFILSRKRIYTYIDNTMEIFEQSKMGLVFYQIRRFYRKQCINSVSESLQKYLRRLFASGLISGKQQESGDYSVYITRMGVTFLYEFGIRFDQRFRKDFSMVNIEYIEIPETEESMECAESLQNVFI